MSIRLTASGLCLVTPDQRVLVEGLDLVVEGGVTGLVGANGSGKSTLLRTLAGQIPPSTGKVTRTGRVQWLAQVSRNTNGTIADALGIASELSRLDRIAAGEGTSEDFELADWALPERAQAALFRVGLEDFEVRHPLASLSGGQHARAILASAWLNTPDILLMDEPTNNLDREGRRAVFDLLATWPGAVVMASHDRALLDRADRILALESPGWQLFGGNYSDYLAERDARHERAEAAFLRADAELRAVNRDKQEAEARLARRARSGKAMRADGSQPKMLLNAMKANSQATASRHTNEAARRAEAASSKRDAADAARARAPKLNVKAPQSDTPASRTMLAFEAVSFGYADTPVLEEFNFNLMGTDRVALEGPNGSGKTTILQLAEGRLQPDAGFVRRGTGRIAKLDQMISDLDPDLSCVEALRSRYPSLSVNSAYSALAQFDIRANAAEKPVSVLSGGERLRVGLAGALGGKPPGLLILDEPTNHLDLDAIEALETALQAYEGSLLVVSHDETFLDAIGIERRITLEPLKRRQH